MPLRDTILGIEAKLKQAQYLYESGDYLHSLHVLCEGSLVRWGLCSRQSYLESMFLSAKCYYQLGENESAIICLDHIINYPDYNHNYISKAEAFRKQIIENM